MKLADILGTGLLAERRTGDTRVTDLVNGSASQHTSDYLALLGNFIDGAMRQCGAQSAGVSLFYRYNSSELTWLRARGDLRDFEGRRFPRRHSPCGVALDANATQLFIRPHRYFQWIEQAGIYISEALVTPIMGPNGRKYGTLWMMTHDGAHAFNQADARALELTSEKISEAISDTLYTAASATQSTLAN